ncbi:hypothetical protein [Streptomyces sp. NPDC001530]|uniref:hypothetical protein n=1 Tax=Streptomyces sp. NPDC001530 TaxID=3364582 RepID=UPI00369CCE6D
MPCILEKWIKVNIGKKALTTAALTTAGLALAAAPASAQTNAHGYASYESCGILSCITIETAEGWFTAEGETLKVCDIYTDGHRAGAELEWYSGGAYHIYGAYATGGDGSCATWTDKDIPEGTSVTMRVWDQNGSTGSRQHLKTFHGTA